MSKWWQNCGWTVALIILAHTQTFFPKSTTTLSVQAFLREERFKAYTFNLPEPRTRKNGTERENDNEIKKAREKHTWSTWPFSEWIKADCWPHYSNSVKCPIVTSLVPPFLLSLAHSLTRLCNCLQASECSRWTLAYWGGGVCVCVSREGGGGLAAFVLSGHMGPGLPFRYKAPVNAGKSWLLNDS